jgi:quercetin dioxygenase-like cupin family protein
MQSWDIKALDASPHKPRIVSSSADARAIVVDLAEGERLQDHEVREHAWIFAVTGELEVSTPDGARVEGGPGLLIELQPGERHEVVARAEARFVLLLAPWPGEGHDGTMTLEEKAGVRERAAELAQGHEPG